MKIARTFWYWNRHGVSLNEGGYVMTFCWLYGDPSRLLRIWLRVPLWGREFVFMRGAK